MQLQLSSGDDCSEYKLDFSSLCSFFGMIYISLHELLIFPTSLPYRREVYWYFSTIQVSDIRCFMDHLLPGPFWAGICTFNATN